MYDFSFFSNIYINSWLKDNHLKKILSQLPKKTLLVHSNWALRENHLARFIELSKNKQIDFLKINQEPSYELITKQFKKIKDYQLIIGVGSGNVMDFCKVLSMSCSDSNKFDSYIYGLSTKVKKASKKKKLWLFPSHYSSSSWVSKSAVFQKNSYKVSCFGDSLIPDKTFIDPNVLNTINDDLYLEMSFDCFAHFYEIYQSISGTNPFFQKILDAWFEQFKTAVNNKDNKALFYLSTFLFSGLIDLSKVEWPIHILSHALGPHLGLSHTKSLLVLMPYFFKSQDSIFQKVYSELFDKYSMDINKSTVKELIKLTLKMNPKASSYSNIANKYSQVFNIID
ncbi:MAG: hypothetical protein COB02_02020 [Candidatus Cloacimonadota bacterium]|nr:MAG: hypothetical protein COB02_02020 [Candidatus Cloacimonadota bacterium]